MQGKVWWIVIGVIVLALAGGAVWWFMAPTEDDEAADADVTQQSTSERIREPDEDDKAAPLAFQPATVATCQGSYLDTHSHWDEDDYPERYAALMKAHKIGCAITFFLVEVSQKEDDLERFTDLYDYPGQFIPFLSIDPETPQNLNPTSVADIIQKLPNTFRGLGELAYYQGQLATTQLVAEPWPKLWQYAEQNNLWVMIHARMGQLADLKAFLSQHPNLKVLLHGPEYPQELPGLLKTYPNLHYTLDTATLLQLPSNPPSILMFPNTESTPDKAKQAFIQKFDQNKAQILTKAVADWAPVVAAAPDRVMWGTDAAFEWHFDQEVFSRIMAFSQDFINQLPESQRQGYAYTNAQRLFLK